ncbi:hypothetical protein EV363DRAFT_1451294 [Boletus edulis]|nr:hypothetical protein EV363DRAFT_1451294 [Boletus edulis]
MLSFAFNKNNRSSRHDPTSDLEYVINHVFFALKEPVTVKEKHDRDPETALRTFIDPVYAAAYAYYEYVDDFHKLQWYHIVQMLGDLRCRYLSEEYLSQLCGMRPGAICVFPLLDERTMIVFRKRDHHTLYERHKLYPKSSGDHGAQEAICSYPDLTVEVPNEVLHDGEFQSELAKLLGYINNRNPPSHKERYGDNAKYGPAMGVIQNTWHRADEWFLIKVAIQSSLDRSLLGRATYKTFMLFFLLTLANYAANASLPSDVFHSMSAKILRRFRKLGTSVPTWLSDAVMQTCSRLLDVLDNRCTRVQIAQRISPPWNPSRLNLNRDVQLSLPRSEYPSLLNLFRGIRLPLLDWINYPSRLNLPRDFQPSSPDFSESPSQLNFPRGFQLSSS